MTTDPFGGPFMGDFPGRPDHPDFWVLVDVVLQHDGKTENPAFDMATHLATVLDPDSVRYMAEQRVRRFVDHSNAPVEVQVAAAWLDAFMIGVEFARRRSTERETALAALLAKVIENGVEYTPSTRYGGFDTPPNVRGYDAHGSANLTHAEEDLLRQCLGLSTEDTP